MKYSIVFIILLTSLQVRCQEKRTHKNPVIFYNHNYKVLQGEIICKDTINYVFGNRVNLRTDSLLNSKVLEQLSHGEEIYILDFNVYHIVPIAGHLEPWVKVRSKKGNVGYIYGALVSKGYLNYDLNKNGTNELILLGNDFENGSNAQLKILEKDKLINTKTIDSLYLEINPETSKILRIINDPKLSSKDILQIGVGSDFCWTFWKSIYFYIKNVTLTKLFEHTTLINNDGISDQIIFPSDSEVINKKN